MVEADEQAEAVIAALRGFQIGDWVWDVKHPSWEPGIVTEVSSGGVVVVGWANVYGRSLVSSAYDRPNIDLAHVGHSDHRA